MLQYGRDDAMRVLAEFQWAPTLGGECYALLKDDTIGVRRNAGFNGHPPLGVNATNEYLLSAVELRSRVSMGTHPWG